METQTLREMAASALVEAQVAAEEREREAKLRAITLLVTACRRQANRDLGIELEGDPDVHQDEARTLVLFRYEDLWLGASIWNSDSRGEGAELAAYDRCEACGEWYPLGRYAYSLQALGDMLAHPAKHGCEENLDEIPNGPAVMAPVPLEQAVRALDNLAAQIGTADDGDATREQLLVPLGLEAIACMIHALVVEAREVAKSGYAGVI